MTAMSLIANSQMEKKNTKTWLSSSIKTFVAFILSV